VAVKIVRQQNKVALLGAPTSAAATSSGSEKAPAALRSAGLVARLQSIGYEVVDLGDDPAQLYSRDEENPRARNVPRVLAALDALKPRVEQAVKSGALPLILSGDASVALATVAGMRRYFRHVSLLYMDRDAGLHTPATTHTGSVDGMVASHATGRGAAELVRFWGEPPLVREPDLAIFGTDRTDPTEEEWLRRAPIRRYLAAEIHGKGAAAAAEAAVQQIHGRGNEYLLHLDVDVIADFQATNAPGSGGLTLDEVRDALATFTSQPHLAAFEIVGYNPDKDPDGAAAGLILDLLADALAKRLSGSKPEEVAPAPVRVTAEVSSTESAQTPHPPAPESQPGAGESIPSPVAPGEAWPSDDSRDAVAEPSGTAAADHESNRDEPSEPSGESPDSRS
jgi:arginase